MSATNACMHRAWGISTALKRAISEGGGALPAPAKPTGTAAAAGVTGSGAVVDESSASGRIGLAPSTPRELSSSGIGGKGGENDDGSGGSDSSDSSDRRDSSTPAVAALADPFTVSVRSFMDDVANDAMVLDLGVHFEMRADGGNLRLQFHARESAAAASAAATQGPVLQFSSVYYVVRVARRIREIIAAC